jgi:hypothetical protein
MDMSTQTDVIVQNAVQRFLDAYNDMKKATIGLVEDMAGMSPHDRTCTTLFLIENMPGDRDWIERMEACAERGLVNAWHLYRQKQIITGLAIKEASAKAILEIADPDTEFPLVENGKTMCVKASNLNRKTAGLVWDRKTGIISASEQAKRIRNANTISTGKNSVMAEIHSMRPYIENGKQYAELELTHAISGDRIVVSIAQLRSLLK